MTPAGTAVVDRVRSLDDLSAVDERAVLSAAERGLQRHAAVVVVGFLLVAAMSLRWAPPEAEVPGAGAVGALLLACAAAAAAWHWVLHDRFGVPSWPGLAMIPTLALVAVVTFKIRSDYQGWWQVAELVAVAAVVGWSLGPLTRVAVGGVALAALLMTLHVALDVSPNTLFITPVAATVGLVRLVTVGGAYAAFARLIRRFAVRTDAITGAAVRASLAAASAAASERERRRRRRIVHDTALNTLEAVAAGAGRTMPGAVVDRCRSDVARWQNELAAGPPPRTSAEDVPRSLGATVDRWRAAGLDITTELTSDDSIPADVAWAITQAVDEALRNVAKHAGPAAVTVTAVASADTTEISVRDDGRGFDPRSTTHGVGLADSILGRLSEVGASVSVESARGEGTTVRIRWSGEAGAAGSASTAGLADMDSRDLTASFSSVAWKILIVTSAANLLLVMFDRGAYVLPAVAAASVIAVLVVGAWAALVARHGPLPGSMSVLLGIVAAGSLLAAPVADPYCATLQRGSMLPDSAVVLLLIPAVLMPTVRWTVANMVIFAAAGVTSMWMWSTRWPPCQQEVAWVLWSTLVMVVGALVFRYVLTEQVAAADGAREAVVSVRLATAEAEATERARAEWEIPVTSTALGLLRDLGTGSRDSADLAVRDEAHRAAAQLRALVMVAGARGPIGRAVGEFTAQLRHRGVAARFSGDPADLADAGPATPRIVASLTALGRSLPDEVATADITVSRLGGRQSVLVHVVAPQLEPEADLPDLGGHSSAEVDLDTWIDEDGLWWHGVWPVAEGAADGS